MKRRFILIAVLSSIAVSVGTPALARLPRDAKATASAYDRCLNRASTNVDFTACGSAYLKGLDIALKVAWTKAYASLDDEESRTRLLQEQRAWTKFKNEACLFWENGSSGREGQVLHFYGCRGSVEARINDLNGLYELTHQDELKP